MRSTQIGYDVYLNGKRIDRVFYSAGNFKHCKNLQEAREEVRRSLINHDGYDCRIIVK